MAETDTIVAGLSKWIENIVMERLYKLDPPLSPRGRNEILKMIGDELVGIGTAGVQMSDDAGVERVRGEVIQILDRKKINFTIMVRTGFYENQRAILVTIRDMGPKDILDLWSDVSKQVYDKLGVDGMRDIFILMMGRSK